MDREKVIEYFAQKVEESRRDEFRERALKTEDVSEAEALGKEFGIEPDEKDKAVMLEMVDDMELSPDMLRKIAGGLDPFAGWREASENC